MAGNCTPFQMTVNVTSPSPLGSFDATSTDNTYNKTITIQQQDESSYDKTLKCIKIQRYNQSNSVCNRLTK